MSFLPFLSTKKSPKMTSLSHAQTDHDEPLKLKEFLRNGCIPYSLTGSL